ncbi:MAG TPA: DUF924 family protein [Gammaproteobacteria bacterium]|nr:DUF924 family protein [Gammaproteobacteria bacterium]
MAAAEPRRAREILDFWFGRLEPDGFPVRPRTRLWFRGTARLDREIAAGFREDMDRAAGGALDDWAGAARSCLALVLLLDQFPRNVHRRTPAAFAGDPKALAICRHALARGHERHLVLAERMFLFMPLQHAEAREVQEASVRLYRQAWCAAAGGTRRKLRGFLDSAVEHRDIVRRFGRFPHRNAILGRDSTPDERAFLEREGRRYGQG